MFTPTFFLTEGKCASNVVMGMKMCESVDSKNVAPCFSITPMTVNLRPPTRHFFADRIAAREERVGDAGAEDDDRRAASGRRRRR